MTAAQSNHSNPGEDVAEIVVMYRRLATTDPPALRSLAVDLQSLSDESAASAALQPTPATQAKARRDSPRAAAAWAAQAPVETEG